MRVEATPVPGILLIHAEPASDVRGAFAELFSTRLTAALAAAVPRPEGYFARPRHVNLSVTDTPGTIRGVHWQHQPFAQGKLVFCVEGAVWDVGTELGPSQFRHFGVRLEPSALVGLYVPEGYGHGFQALKPHSKVLYVVFGAPWRKEAEQGARPDDPKLGIRWPLDPVLVSERDRTWPLL